MGPRIGPLFLRSLWAEAPPAHIRHRIAQVSPHPAALSELTAKVRLADGVVRSRIA
jgi:hypothetical protein